MTNNNRETLQAWIDEQISAIDEADGACVGLVLLINPAGDTREVYSLKSGSAKWTTAAEMTDLFWTQATRTAKGVPGFVQFQIEATFSNGNGKATRFMPFGLMGATQLGPAAGGTSYGGLATEAPTPMGMTSQAMRLHEIQANGYFQGMVHIINTLQRSNEQKDARMDVMEKRMDEQWLALKTALLEIQNAAATKELRLLYAEVSRKVLTLLPGLANALSGKEIFPQQIVEQSMIDTISANFSPEEQQGLISMVQAHPNGQLLAGVLTDQLLRAKKRRETESTELSRATSGLPSRSYADGEEDAAGMVMRVMKGQPRPEPKALQNGKTNGTNGHAKTETKPAVVDMEDNDSKLIDDLLEGVPEEQLDMMVQVLSAQKPGLGDRIKARYKKLKGEKP